MLVYFDSFIFFCLLFIELLYRFPHRLHASFQSVLSRFSLHYFSTDVYHVMQIIYFLKPQIFIPTSTFSTIWALIWNNNRASWDIAFYDYDTNYIFPPFIAPIIGLFGHLENWRSIFSLVYSTLWYRAVSAWHYEVFSELHFWLLNSLRNKIISHHQ